MYSLSMINVYHCNVKASLFILLLVFLLVPSIDRLHAIKFYSDRTKDVKVGVVLAFSTISYPTFHHGSSRCCPWKNMAKISCYGKCSDSRQRTSHHWYLFKSPSFLTIQRTETSITLHTTESSHSKQATSGHYLWTSFDSYRSKRMKRKKYQSRFRIVQIMMSRGDDESNDKGIKINVDEERHPVSERTSHLTVQSKSTKKNTTARAATAITTTDNNESHNSRVFIKNGPSKKTNDRKQQKRTNVDDVGKVVDETGSVKRTRKTTGSRQSPKKPISSYGYSWGTALAIVPPDDAWDQIQRARHQAGDVLYSLWPPAIRLFHPFVSGVDDGFGDNLGDSVVNAIQESALQIASSVIEKYNIEPFSVTLSRWSIIPNDEAIATMMMATTTVSGRRANNINGYRQVDYGTNGNPQELLTKQQQEDQKIRQLIDQEERIGKEKLALRLEKQLKQKQRKNSSKTKAKSNINDKTTTSKKQQRSQPRDEIYPSEKTDSDPQRIHQQEQHLPSSGSTQHSHNEFNGPCILCLEPDWNSQQVLRELRQRLVVELFQSHELCSSPSSLYVTNTNSIAHYIEQYRSVAALESRRRSSWGTSLDPAMNAETYRPIVPIASFPTVDSAIPVARMLRESWKPLQFNVSDLQIMSSQSSKGTNHNIDILPSSINVNRFGGIDSQYSARISNNYVEELVNIKEDVVVPSHEQQIPCSVSNSFEYNCHSDQNLSGRSKTVDNEYYTNIKKSKNKFDLQDDRLNAYRGEFGCDALIALIGEEIKMDDQLNQEIVNAVFEQGENGGGYELLFLESQSTNQQKQSSTATLPSSMASTAKSKDSIKINNIRDSDLPSPPLSDFLEQWLDEDEDDYDEGTVVVIGRTHFLTGAMRQYVGMPASSTLVDFKTSSSRSSGSRVNKAPHKSVTSATDTRIVQSVDDVD